MLPLILEVEESFNRMSSWVKPGKIVCDWQASLYADMIDVEEVVYDGPDEDDCVFTELGYEMPMKSFINRLWMYNRLDTGLVSQNHAEGIKPYRYLQEGTVTYYERNKFDGKDAINWNCDVITKSGPIIVIEWPSNKRWLRKNWPKNQFYIRNSMYWHKYDGDEGGPHYENE